MVKITIQNVRVFDSEVIQDPKDVVIMHSSGSIVDPMNDGSAEDTSDVVIDGQGCTLVPGFIDVYANIKGANAALGTFASHGITTVIDLSSNTQQCQALRVYAAGRTRLPTVLTSGTEAAPARGFQPHLYDNPDEEVIRTPEDAVAFVSARATGPDRADFIKVVVDLHSLDDSLLRTIVDAAHAHKKLTIARTSGKASYERAMRAGFDIFVHAPLDAPLDPELARNMAAQQKILVPTLNMMRDRVAGSSPGAGQPSTLEERIPPGFPVPGIAGNKSDKNDDDDDRVADRGSRIHSDPGIVKGNTYNNAVESVRAAYEAGVTICAGTTANVIPGAQIPFGQSLHEELRLLVEAGMSELDVLRSATCVAATAFRLKDRGIIRGGLRADLVLIDGDPLEDISATRRIKKIWIQGEEVEPEHQGR
ncbi:Adenine deaminase 2 [Colletotrichum orbiculare MAFF 240422]|uniref:Adenine deaminase 2 n=1 Tax=Colletotrichum orbiculare (strain 104-T / ATCC 96160 / CBS 514.97 / LARS 414 / MAFF 240422) TaxID=1213857 RepID=N4W0T7_COLOR|nr:Adenine deaminase 2 [Colletotrichum orbiculare MAFF 240422]